MFGIGSTELLVILLVALIVMGPRKLPQIARTMGKAFGEFKRVSSGFKQTIDMEVQKAERQEREDKAKRDLLADDAAPAKPVSPELATPAEDPAARPTVSPEETYEAEFEAQAATQAATTAPSEAAPVSKDAEKA